MIASCSITDKRPIATSWSSKRRRDRHRRQNWPVRTFPVSDKNPRSDAIARWTRPVGQRIPLMSTGWSLNQRNLSSSRFRWSSSRTSATNFTFGNYWTRLRGGGNRPQQRVFHLQTESSVDRANRIIDLLRLKHEANGVCWSSSWDWCSFGRRQEFVWSMGLSCWMRVNEEIWRNLVSKSKSKKFVDRCEMGNPPAKFEQRAKAKQRASPQDYRRFGTGWSLPNLSLERYNEPVSRRSTLVRWLTAELSNYRTDRQIHWLRENWWLISVWHRPVRPRSKRSELSNCKECGKKRIYGRVGVRLGTGIFIKKIDDRFRREARSFRWNTKRRRTNSFDILQSVSLDILQSSHQFADQKMETVFVRSHDLSSNAMIAALISLELHVFLFQRNKHTPTATMTETVDQWTNGDLIEGIRLSAFDHSRWNLRQGAVVNEAEKKWKSDFSKVSKVSESLTRAKLVIWALKDEWANDETLTFVNLWHKELFVIRKI